MSVGIWICKDCRRGALLNLSRSSGQTPGATRVRSLVQEPSMPLIRMVEGRTKLLFSSSRICTYKGRISASKVACLSYGRQLRIAWQ